MHSFFTSVLDGSKRSVWQASQFTREEIYTQYPPKKVTGGPGSRSAWLYDIFDCNWVATRWQYYSTHLHTNTIHRTTQNEQYIEQHKHFGRVRAVPRLCGFYPGIRRTTEEKARKNLSECSRRMPAGTTKTHKHTIRIHRHNNKNT